MHKAIKVWSALPIYRFSIAQNPLRVKGAMRNHALGVNIICNVLRYIINSAGMVSHQHEVFVLLLPRNLACGARSRVRFARSATNNKAQSFLDWALLLERVDKKDATVFIHYTTRTFEKIDLFF